MEALLMAVLTTAATAATGYLVASIPAAFRWLRAQADRSEALRQTTLDNDILDALETGVSNVGHSLRLEMERTWAGAKDWDARWEGMKRTLRDAAVEQAREMLQGPALAAFQNMSAAAVDALVRRVVDRQADEERARAAYVDATVAGERAYRAAREAAQAAAEAKPEEGGG